MNYLSELSIADLVALHTNFYTAGAFGARFLLISPKQFEAVEKELMNRLNSIDYVDYDENLRN